MEKRKSERGWIVVLNSLWNLKNVSVSLCLSTKLGEMDRGRRPRGSLPQPGADEEQPVGGERKVHPSLEETGHQSNYPDWCTPTRWPLNLTLLTRPTKAMATQRLLTSHLECTTAPLTFLEHNPPQKGHRKTHWQRHTLTQHHSKLWGSPWLPHIHCKFILPRQCIITMIYDSDDQYSYYTSLYGYMMTYLCSC